MPRSPSRGMLLLASTSMFASATTCHSPARYARHALELRDRGYTVIADAGLDPTLVADAKVACAAALSRSLDMIDAIGLDPMEDSYAFAEIDKRHRLRWSLQATRQSAWTRLTAAAIPTAAAVIEHVHTSLPPHPDDAGPPLMDWTRHLLPAQPTQRSVGAGQIGAIISKPGAKAQKFHADAGDAHLSLAKLCPRHRMYNVFVPLVDLDDDGTMMWPGSHLHRTRADAWYEAVGRSGSLEDDARAMAEMEVPACPAGGVILFVRERARDRTSSPLLASVSSADWLCPRVLVGHRTFGSSIAACQTTPIATVRWRTPSCRPALRLIRARRQAASVPRMRRCPRARVSGAGTARRWRRCSVRRGCGIARARHDRG